MSDYTKTIYVYDRIGCGVVLYLVTVVGSFKKYGEGSVNFERERWVGPVGTKTKDRDLVRTDKNSKCIYSIMSYMRKPNM